MSSAVRWAAAIAVAVLVSGLAPAASAQLFRRPVACDGCIANWYYFDQIYDPDGGSRTQDWNCAASTYDDHRGSDFSLAGGNGAIDAGYAIVAMADGVVERVHDGAYDHCTACGGDGCGTSIAWGYGNHVVVNHGDRKTIYAHMRTGSVRVAVGDSVTCGQVLGEIGSSGCSTGAHLHVEVRPLGASATAAYDPFHGACSAAASAWVDQGPHRGMPGATCSDGTTPPPPDDPPVEPPPTATCPSGTWPIWTCTTDRTARRRCIDGVVEEETCTEGCIVYPVGTDDECRDSGVPPAPVVDAGSPGTDAGMPDPVVPPAADAGVDRLAPDGGAPADPMDPWPPGTPDPSPRVYERGLSGGCSAGGGPAGAAPLGLVLAVLALACRRRGPG